jgi:hypothetical protein
MRKNEIVQSLREITEKHNCTGKIFFLSDNRFFLTLYGTESNQEKTVQELNNQIKSTLETKEQSNDKI